MVILLTWRSFRSKILYIYGGLLQEIKISVNHISRNELKVYLTGNIKLVMVCLVNYVVGVAGELVSFAVVVWSRHATFFLGRGGGQRRGRGADTCYHSNFSL